MESGSSTSDSAGCGWGRIRHGQTFSRIADDLDRALSVSFFTGYEHIILKRVRDLAFKAASVAGRPDPLPFVLNVGLLAQQTGVRRQKLQAAKQRLIKCRVLLSREDGSLEFNKDVLAWLNPDGTRRLSDAMVRYCREPQGQTGVTPAGVPVPPLRGAPVGGLGAPFEGQGGDPAEGHKETPKGVSRRPPTGSQRDPLRGHVLENREKRLLETTRTGGGSSTAGSGESRTSEPPAETPSTVAGGAPAGPGPGGGERPTPFVGSPLVDDEVVRRLGYRPRFKWVGGGR